VDKFEQILKQLAKLALVLIVIAGVLFGSAATLDFWQAWLFLAVYCSGAFGLVAYLIAFDPLLLERRSRGGPTAETSTVQKVAMTIFSVAFVGGLVLAGLDHRFHWSAIPLSVVLMGDGLIAVGFLIVLYVFRVNSFAAATIELAPDQRVISTGPYALVRHPMYAGGLLLLAGIPIALGSWWGLLGVAAMLPALIWRLIDEERFLAARLPGYTQYLDHVRYRLLPLVW